MFGGCQIEGMLVRGILRELVGGGSGVRDPLLHIVDRDRLQLGLHPRIQAVPVGF